MALSISRRLWVPPSTPLTYAPITLNSPMSPSASAASPLLKPSSVRYAGRCVETNAMWKPQTKKPHASST